MDTPDASIPNIPFFYLVFRAWSHWRGRYLKSLSVSGDSHCTARCGSEHIEFLVKNKLFEKSPSSVLDTAYAVNSIGVSLGRIQQDVKHLSAPGQGLQQAESQSHEPAEEMLLSKADGIFIADCLNIPELAPEIERAVWQVERAIKARRKAHNKNTELESAKAKRENR